MADFSDLRSIAHRKFIAIILKTTIHMFELLLSIIIVTKKLRAEGEQLKLKMLMKGNHETVRINSDRYELVFCIKE